MKKRVAKRKIHVAHREKAPLWKQLIIGLLLLVFFGLLVYGVFKVTRLDRFQVANIVVSGGETVSHDVIENIAAQELEGTYYKVIPRRFVFTTPEEKIIAAVENLPRVSDAEVETFENEVRVAITEYAPYALLCDAENCFFTADDGTVFARAPELRGRSLIRVEFSDPIEIGDVVIDPNQLVWMTAVRDALLKDFSWSVRAFSLLNDTDVAIFFTNSTLFVQNTLTPNELVVQIQQILSSEEFSHLTPEEIEYVDMRYGNKVFVKERVDEEESVENEATESLEESV